MLDSVTNLLRLPPKIMSGLMIASGLILFLPNEIISKLYMSNFKAQYGFIIGTIFIVSISILSCYIVARLLKSFYDNKVSKKWLKVRMDVLNALSLEEKELLKAFIHTPDRTLKLPVNNGITIKLGYYEIITPAGSTHVVDGLDMRIPYFLQPWVQSELVKHPELLI